MSIRTKVPEPHGSLDLPEQISGTVNWGCEKSQNRETLVFCGGPLSSALSFRHLHVIFVDSLIHELLICFLLSSFEQEAAPY